jgi:hypothetical protein
MKETSISVQFTINLPIPYIYDSIDHARSSSNLPSTDTIVVTPTCSTTDQSQITSGNPPAGKMVYTATPEADVHRDSFYKSSPSRKLPSPISCASQLSSTIGTASRSNTAANQGTPGITVHDPECAHRRADPELSRLGVLYRQGRV